MGKRSICVVAMHQKFEQNFANCLNWRNFALMNEDILDQLNASQREAALYCDGAELVIAGAGSGKTRVLTYKIAYLLSNGYKPWNILALTFTNKAAAEMKERISRLVGHDKARLLNMGTFHSVFSRILRAEAAHIGYEHNFTIYDQGDSRSLVKTIIKEMGLDEKQYNHTSVADRISMAKNHLIAPQAYAMGEQPKVDAQRRVPAIKDIYMRYASRCRQANAMDFDDLLMNTFFLFDANDNIRRKYAERFSYVLVDEYQDTNFAQQAIVMQLTKEHQHICAVGDDAQSIYGFRGANIDNILNFTNAYDNAKLFKLEQNYRSTQMIVQAANSLIRHNERQIPKNVFSDNEHGEKIVFRQAYSDREEAAIVCREIERLRRKEGCGYGDFAILYRTNSQSRSFEEAMRKEGIPYRVFGGLSFYQRKEIKDIIAYFRLVANNDDEEAFRRIINYPARGIGDTTMAKIARAANDHGVSLWTVASQPAVFDLDVNRGVVAKLDAFCSMVKAWTERITQVDAYVLGQEIITESGISNDIYAKREPEDLARQENVVEFLAGMQDFVEDRREEEGLDGIFLPDFLQEVALLTDLDSDEEDEDGERVSLMTIHSAKGLEFPSVFIVGLEDNIFPSPMSCNSLREIEEERRLLYVAITRAEKHCFLTCAQSRFRYGRVEYGSPSRFIKDIAPAYLKVELINKPDAAQSTFNFRGSGYGGRYDKPEWQQNPRPVASQFKADPKPREVPPRVERRAAPPFSDAFADKLANAPRLKLRPVANVGKADIGLACSSGDLGIKVGNVIEHQRFGIGTVLNIEGQGENTKATVQFQNSGTKQLLLKFARYKLIR